MFVTIGKTPMRVGRVQAGDIIVNTGNVPVYLADDVVSVLNAPNTGTPIYAGGQLVWDHDSYPLWAIDPSGNSPTIQITHGSSDQNTGLLASSDVPQAVFPYQATTVPAGGAGSYSSVTLPVMNVARYASLKVQTQATGVSIPYYDVVFQWSIDPTFSGIQAIVDEETFGFPSNATANQQIAGHVVVRAPYLRIELRNWDTVQKPISLGVFGSNRIEERSQFHSVVHNNPLLNGNGSDNVLATDSLTCPAGVTTVWGDLNFYNGPVTVRFRCTDTASIPKQVLLCAINAQPTGTFNASSHLQWTLPLDAAIGASKQPLVDHVTLPRRVCSIAVTNNDTSSHNVGFTVFAQEL